VHVLCNHFKSKGYGSQASSNAKRKLQAQRVAELLQRYDLKKDLVVVGGDFNDTPDSDPISPLKEVAHLKDVLDWSGFTGTRNTYHTGRDQIDYLLVSKPLFEAIQEVGIERRGIFKRGNESFSEVTSKATQASDHACVWATFEL
jgi:predicted extracellular nuclease